MFPVACLSNAFFAAGPMSPRALAALDPIETPAPISLNLGAASYTCTSRCEFFRSPKARHKPPMPPPMMATLIALSVLLMSPGWCGRDAIGRFCKVQEGDSSPRRFNRGYTAPLEISTRLWVFTGNIMSKVFEERTLRKPCYIDSLTSS